MKTVLGVFLVGVVLSSCSHSNQNQTALVLSEVPHLRLIDFHVDDSLSNRAVSLIRNELKRKNEPLDSLFITAFNHDTIRQIIQFEITHFTSFKKQQEALEIQGTEIYIPPTGNLSGHDRTIIYHISSQRIEDVKHQ